MVEDSFFRGLLGVTLFWLSAGEPEKSSIGNVAAAVAGLVGGKISSIVFLGGSRGFSGPFTLLGKGEISRNKSLNERVA